MTDHLTDRDRSQEHAALALGGLDPAAAEKVATHAAGCPACAAELEGFRETAARLGAAASAAPPASLRADVLAAVARTRQLPPEVRPDTPSGTNDPAVVPITGSVGRWRRRWPLLAAAAVLAAGGIGLGALLGDREPADQTAVMTECVAQAADGRPATPMEGSTGTGMVMVYPSCGGATVQLAELPPVPAGMTYQLWVLSGTGARSAGMMTPAADGTLPKMMAPVRIGDTAIELTMEPMGGSPAPTSKPVVMVELGH